MLFNHYGVLAPGNHQHSGPEETQDVPDPYKHDIIDRTSKYIGACSTFAATPRQGELNKLMKNQILTMPR
jgi:hypothetical protein